jgi:hypothetical protein
MLNYPLHNIISYKTRTVNTNPVKTSNPALYHSQQDKCCGPVGSILASCSEVPGIPTEVFHNFPQSFQANAKSVP